MSVMRVLGTAGHVDHGKSALVQALTGINPDRLREEQERQMTIDLGFAWMELPDGESVGIVDVPGHRDFIENMLAGVGGIDAALFVVAADEGVMPQTREHLAILDMLDVQQGVVALTKIDLLEDLEWLHLVREEVQQLLNPTSLAAAPIVPVSALRREGLSELVAAISEVLGKSPPRNDLGRARLSLDRAFTIAGFGTVVTGTLVDGSLVVGQEIELLPQGLRGRIRGLQTHKAKVDRAVPGSRVAINLSGIDVRQLSRGDVIAQPGAYLPTSMIDVRFEMLRDAERPLRHDKEVKLFLGAAQRMAKVRLLGADALAPGSEGWLQLVLESPVVASIGDRFILRRPSPGATLGGGEVADPHPQRRHRRRDTAAPERLERQLRGAPAERLAQSLATLGPISLASAVRHSGLERSVAKEALAQIVDQDGLVAFGEGALDLDSEVLVVGRDRWHQELERMQAVLREYHKAHVLRQGMPREELKSRLGLEARIFTAELELARAEGEVGLRGQIVFLAEHRITLTGDQAELVKTLMLQFEEAPYNPPSAKECKAHVGGELLNHLLESGRLVQVSPEVVFERNAYEALVMGVEKMLEERGMVTVAEVRDGFGTSRKFALALMEHLDDTGLTIREGDVRRLRRKRSER